MTRIRIPQIVASIAPERMAALVTSAVVNPMRDDAPASDRSNTPSWVRWFDERSAGTRLIPHTN
jgi:hypothetical protein